MVARRLALVSLLFGVTSAHAKTGDTHADVVVTTSVATPASAKDGIHVTVTVRNDSASPQRFCVYFTPFGQTPFEAIKNDLFEIVDAKKFGVEYRGVLARRAPPGPKDYITLASHAAKSATIDIKSAYPMSPGAYKIRQRGNDINLLPSSELVSFTVVP